MSKRLFTSESVTEGHPDKMADQISDAILDDLLRQDPRSRVAVETMLTTGQVHVAGEVTTDGFADVMKLVRDTVLHIGYDSSEKGFDGSSCGIQVSIGKQSPDIAQGVDDAIEEREGKSGDPLDRQGAGDQGLMFGYACTDTVELMPLPISLAHRLAERLTLVRKDGTLSYLRADGKTQVTVEYDENDRPIRIDTIVVSSQHAEHIDLDKDLGPDIRRLVVEPILETIDLDSKDYRLLVNPTGKFVVGGPMGDAGLTGRKIIVDTYGGMARHGGGAFSGKDPSKVDRSAAYAMRWSPRMLLLLVWRRGVSFRSPTRSARLTRLVCSSRPSVLASSAMRRFRRPCFESSTYVQLRSFAILTCFARFIERRARMDTLVVRRERTSCSMRMT